MTMLPGADTLPRRAELAARRHAATASDRRRHLQRPVRARAPLGARALGHSRALGRRLPGDEDRGGLLPRLARHPVAALEPRAGPGPRHRRTRHRRACPHPLLQRGLPDKPAEPEGRRLLPCAPAAIHRTRRPVLAKSLLLAVDPFRRGSPLARRFVAWAGRSLASLFPEARAAPLDGRALRHDS